MTTDLDPELRAVLDEIVSRTPPAGSAPSHDAGRVERGSRVLVGAAVVVVLVLGVAALVAQRRQGGEVLIAAEPSTSTTSGVKLVSPAIPSISDFATSAPDDASAVAAERLAGVVGGFGWDVELREHATRTTSHDETTRWVSFADGDDLRLFIVEGPAGLVDSATLRPVGGGYQWPAERDATTIAVESETTTLIIRSETVEGSDGERAVDDLVALAREIEGTQSTEISPLLISYLFPVDGEDFVQGWQAVEAPRMVSLNRSIADCFGEEGFPTFGAALAASGPVRADDLWRFPVLEELVATGFATSPSSPALDAIGSIEFEPITDLEHSLVVVLSQHPELGVAGNLGEVNEFNEAAQLCIEQNQLDADTERALALRMRWNTAVDDVDEIPELVEQQASADACLADAGLVSETTGPGRDVAESVDGFLNGLRLDERTTHDDLVDAGQSYAVCVEPLVLARRDHLIEQRTLVVQQTRTDLVDLERSLLD